jgi:hypothetical protein
MIWFGLPVVLEFRFGIISRIRYPSKAVFISTTIILFSLEKHSEIRRLCPMRLLNFRFGNLTPLDSDDQSEVSGARKSSAERKSSTAFSTA